MKLNLHFSALIFVFAVFIAASSMQAQSTKGGIKADIIEDFETGDFSQFDWQLSGNSNWSVVDASPYEGLFCARSGIITHSQSTTLELEYEVYAEDVLSFWYKVSSENNYDYLTFYIDNVEIDAWAGTVPWTLFEYTVPVGTHTFKWVYDKDGSVSSGEDACWIDFITFPPMQIEAFFTTDTVAICKGEPVQYFDQSIGPVTEWNWTFEGATPTTSTNQNPWVAYAQTGYFDVLLEVSDGIESSSYYAAEYMEVQEVLQTANMPSGISLLCASWGNSTYNTAPVTGASSYNWTISPEEAGTISGNGGTNITLMWAPDFLGTAELRVAGVNYCGTGVYSNPLNITRYLPDVNLIVPAYVAISTPAFELTGGTPAGGTYSGPGVSNGMFDPSVAGLGEHTITYTFTDVNFCTNTATDLLTVTQFTGYENIAEKSGVHVYPNPSEGMFTLRLNQLDEQEVNLVVYNALSDVVYIKEGLLLTEQHRSVINLSELPKGVYYLKISGKNLDSVQKLVIQK
ncbi:MAG TPA: T9SS type A sorting domain-containing protein [Bacteroidales bacterium]|nr:T9SS type A sorting domain-containing protein [Bacteroidales bacterium]HPE56944.1 T9SS type A sorting domain-containing protein [Bacteroidales bacterium]